MKKSILVNILLLISLFLIAGCDDSTKDVSNQSLTKTYTFNMSNDSILNDETIHRLNSSGFNAFSSIYSEKSNENIIFSPISLSSALAMLEEGSDGITQEEIRNFLKLEEDDTIDKTFNHLMTHFKNITKESSADDRKTNTIHLANSLWYRNKDFKLKNSYLKTIKTHYDGDIFSVDFSKKKTKNLMNQWIEERTNYLLKDTIKQINPSTVAYLVNTTYFNAEWENPFDQNNTSKKDFYLEDDSEVTVNMMAAKDRMNYYENDTYQLVGLAYPQSTMYVILPKDSLNHLVENVTYEDLVMGQNNTSYKTVNLNLPKFDYNNEIDLVKLLKDLGISSAFDFETANFNNMIESNQEIKLSSAFQNATISVDEKGTKAAAVTVLEMIESAMPMDDQEIVVHCNKPFMFMIKDNKSDALLFMGVVNNPSN